MVLFGRTNTQKTPIHPIHNGDGTIDVLAVAHAALTVGTLYGVQWDEFGFVTVALSNVAQPMYVGTPTAAVSSGAVGRLRIGGYVASVTTASLDLDIGDAVDISGGVTADGGTTLGNASFAVAVDDDGGSATTTHNLMFLGREIVSAAT